MCYYERHGVMDGTILTISFMAALQGGKVFLHRPRDFRVPQELSFPLRQAREWQGFLRSAKLWTKATPAELQNEVDLMISERGAYKPKIVFENPRRLEEASSSDVWQPVLKDNGEPESGGAPVPMDGCIPEEGDSSAIVADEAKESDIQISPAEVQDDLHAPSPAVGGEDVPADV